MRPGKWKSFSPADDSRDYLALLSYLPLKRFRTIPKFIKLTSEIEKQLRDSAGLIGYSLQAQLMSRRFWTLSVWESEAALMEFVRMLPHGEVMRELAADMGETRFTRWRIKGRALPPSWNEAKGRMAKSLR